MFSTENVWFDEHVKCLIYIQYTCTYIVSKYNICLYEFWTQVEKLVFGDIFWPVLERVDINVTFTDNVRILQSPNNY